MRAAVQHDLPFDPPSRRTHPDGLARAKALASAGQCIFCEEPAESGPEGRKRIICRKRGCYRAYHRAYGRDRRIAKLKLFDFYGFTRTFRAIAKNIEKLERLAPQAPKELP